MIGDPRVGITHIEATGLAGPKKISRGGRWRIQGNQVFLTTHFTKEESDTGKPKDESDRYTILLLDRDYFIFTDDEYVFFHRRRVLEQ